MIAAPRQPVSPAWLRACVLALLAPPPARAQADPAPIGGTLAATTDYIYRGVSQSDGHGALQADLHASSSAGTFAGVWASTRDDDFAPGPSGEMQIYLGQRLSLGSACSATRGGASETASCPALAGRTLDGL